MRLPNNILVFVVVCLVGCRNLNRSDLEYREMRVENTFPVKITSVRMGGADHHSDFGVLGSKGAGATAGVPVRFVEEFPIEWEENYDGIWHHAVVDLRRFKDIENRAIILRYKGGGIWEAELGREIRPRKAE